jgi:hypothetical protein
VRAPFGGTRRQPGGPSLQCRLKRQSWFGLVAPWRCTVPLPLNRLWVVGFYMLVVEAETDLLLSYFERNAENVLTIIRRR